MKQENDKIVLSRDDIANVEFDETVRSVGSCKIDRSGPFDYDIQWHTLTQMMERAESSVVISPIQSDGKKLLRANKTIDDVINVNMADVGRRVRNGAARIVTVVKSWNDMNDVEKIEWISGLEDSVSRRAMFDAAEDMFTGAGISWKDIAD